MASRAIQVALINVATDAGSTEGDMMVSRQFSEGYDEAANICMGLLSKKIDDLLSQVKAGEYLSEQEQFLLSSLHEMRAEMDAALRDL